MKTFLVIVAVIVVGYFALTASADPQGQGPEIQIGEPEPAPKPSSEKPPVKRKGKTERNNLPVPSVKPDTSSSPRTPIPFRQGETLYI